MFCIGGGSVDDIGWRSRGGIRRVLIDPSTRGKDATFAAEFAARWRNRWRRVPMAWSRRQWRQHIGTSRASSSKSKLILFCVAVSVHSCPSAAAVVRPKSKSSLSSSIVRPTSWWILEDARRRFHGGHISTMARRKKILSTGGHRRRRDV